MRNTLDLFKLNFNVSLRIFVLRLFSVASNALEHMEAKPGARVVDLVLLHTLWVMLYKSVLIL